MIQVFILSLLAFLQSLLPLPTYVEGTVGQPLSFNPVKLSTNQIDRDISDLLFRSLVKYDLKGVLIPDLAESWEISSDGREYTFWLKPNLHWHDGQAITADDILYTVSQMPQLKEIPTDKMGNLTVCFHLKEPLAPFLDILTLGLIPAHMADHNDDLQPVASGDFRVLRVKKTGKVDQIVLQSQTRRLIFSFYNSAEELMAAAKVGEIDGYLSETSVSEEKLVNFNYYQIPVFNRYYALFFNLDKENIKDVELRRSLAQTVPKERLVKEVFAGNATVVDGPLDGSWAESAAYKKYIYDPQLDKNYDLSLTLTIPNKEEHRRTAQIIKESWEKIGVHLNVTEVATEKIRPDIIAPKNFEILLLGQEVSRDSDRYTLWHSTQKDLPGLNFIALKQVRVDRALEEGRKAQSLEERLTHYEHLQTVFAEEVPVIFLYRPIADYAIKKKIDPTGLSAVFFLKDRLADFGSWEFK